MRTDKIDRFTMLICSFFLTVSLSGCADNLSNPKEKIITENVMAEGDRIIAVNDCGELTITAGKANKRYLTLSGSGTHAIWLGDTVSVKLTEREKRYCGSLGLYCKLTNVKKIRNKSGGGEPTRIEMEEAQLHFDTLEAAKEWLGIVKFDKGFNSHAWSSDGLYIRWEYVNPEYWVFPTQTYLYVLVFQIYVEGDKLALQQSEGDTRFWYGDNVLAPYPELLKKLEKAPVKIGGHKPSNLPDAQNDKIRVEHLTDEQLKKFEKSWG